ncbi:MAG: hypothetical protein ACXV2C_00225 [Candidatus Bathyarchaeia archaeon]
MKQKEKKKPYINNMQLYGVMQTYHASTKKAKEEGKKLPNIPDYVGECFILICNKLSGRGNFVSYSYRDEMVSDAIENCVAAVDSFDPEKSKNPFAYFTQIAWYAFIRRIAKEKKQTYIKHKNFENNDMLNELVNDAFTPGGRSTNEYSDDVIRTFEEKMEKTKKPKKKGLAKIIGD